ncbi:MAG: MFS transporter, partial [Thermoplasmata archaeon]|nr:MFS transporter [Euryarchaeota archaeon]
GIIILALPLNFYAVIVAMILLGIPHGAIYPMSTIMISRGTDIKERNAVNSYFVAFGNIIAIVVPPLFGYLLSYFGFRLLIASLSIPVVFFYILFRKRYFNEKFLYR